jgi:hypothetical protein
MATLAHACLQAKKETQMPIPRTEPPQPVVTIYCTFGSTPGTWNATMAPGTTISTNSTNVSADIIAALTAAHTDDSALLMVWSPSGNRICTSHFIDFKAGALIAPH